MSEVKKSYITQSSEPVNSSVRDSRHCIIMKGLFFCLFLVLMLPAKAYAKPKVLLAGWPGHHNSERKMLTKYGFKVISECPKNVNVNKYDGLVVPGNYKNITPKLYGQKKDIHTTKGDLELDKRQIRIVKKFMKAKKPIFGVCRGCQLINVALGGTLIQHIGVKRGGKKSGHHKGYHTGNRKIRIKKDSWMYQALQKEVVSVRHSHQQCVKKLGKGLVATQWDVGSGLIEGIEHETLPVYAVQWHPDLMKGKIPGKVCKCFYKEVINYKKSKQQALK